MAKVRAEVLGPWIHETVPFPVNRPKLRADYPGIETTTDVTGQPVANLIPNPNLVSLEIVCEDTLLAQIEADPTYSVLWSQEV